MKYVVKSSCRSARNICGGIEIRSYNDSFVAQQQDDYFADNEETGERGYVRKVISHRTFSSMSCSSGETDTHI